MRRTSYAHDMHSLLSTVKSPQMCTDVSTQKRPEKQLAETPQHTRPYTCLAIGSLPKKPTGSFWNYFYEESGFCLSNNICCENGFGERIKARPRTKGPLPGLLNGSAYEPCCATWSHTYTHPVGAWCTWPTTHHSPASQWDLRQGPVLASWSFTEIWKRKVFFLENKHLS